MNQKQTSLCLAVVLAFALFGCGNDLTCKVKGDNVKGRINFATNSVLLGGTNVVVQYSEDNFATVEKTETIWNLQGLPSVPYSICADFDSTFRIRAFQDTNGDGAWATGEMAGRDDGTDTGNGTFIDHTIATPAENAEDSFPTVTIDVFLDETTAQ